MRLRSIALTSVALLILLGNLPVPSAESESEPARAPVVELEAPSKDAGPLAIARGAGSLMWFSEGNISKVASYDVETGEFEEYDVPTQKDSLEIWGMDGDTEGRIWFSDATENKIRMLDPTDGSFREFPIPTTNAQPAAVRVDDQGAIWFAELQGGKLGKLQLDENSGQYTIEEFPVPTENTGILGLHIDEEDNLWFTEFEANRIGLFDPESEEFREFPLSPLSRLPVWLTTDKDSHVWFTQFNTGKIGRLDPGTGDVDHFPMGIPSQAYGMVNHPSGDIWFVETRGNRIGRFAPDTLSLTEYSIPTESALINFLAVGPRGNIWFAEKNGNKIGYILAGHVDSVAIQPERSEVEIAPGQTVSLPLTLQMQSGGLGSAFYPLPVQGNMIITSTLQNLSAVVEPSLLNFSESPSIEGRLVISAEEDLLEGAYLLSVGVVDGSSTRVVYVTMIVRSSQPLVSSFLVLAALVLLVALGTALIWRRRRGSSA